MDKIINTDGRVTAYKLINTNGQYIRSYKTN